MGKFERIGINVGERKKCLVHFDTIRDKMVVTGAYCSYSV